MAEVMDRKFKINAVSLKSGKKYTQHNSILFLLKDALLPDMLDKYHQLSTEKGVDGRQLEGIRLLKERVLSWQRKNINKVHLPDIDVGKEEKRVNRPNK